MSTVSELLATLEFARKILAQDSAPIHLTRLDEIGRLIQHYAMLKATDQTQHARQEQQLQTLVAEARDHDRHTVQHEQATGQREQVRQVVSEILQSANLPNVGTARYH